MSEQYVPINDDHAIQAVVFVVFFNDDLSAEQIDALENEEHGLRENLPSLKYPQSIRFDVKPDSHKPDEVHKSGVEFSYHRPDGSPAWLLRAIENYIQIEVTRYTRWAKVRDFASELLAQASLALAKCGRPAFSKCTFVVIDRYEQTKSPADLNNLFQENALLPGRIYTAGDLWHTNLGWFVTHDNHRILEQINLSSKREHFRGRRGSDGTPPLFTVIEHIQEGRLPTHHKFSNEEMHNTLWPIFEDMHERNKALLQSLLNKDQAKRIGLTGEK